jgi:hypothetical protein
MPLFVFLSNYGFMFCYKFKNIDLVLLMNKLGGIFVV